MWKKEVQQFDRQLIIFITIYFFFVGTVGIGQPLIDMYQGITLNVSYLRILIHYIENIEGRTLHICKSKYPSFKTPNSSRKLYKNPLFLAEYELCLKQNFEHFNVIREAVKILDGIIRWPMFLAILTFSLVLACALLTLIKGDTRIAPQLLSIMLLLMEAIACAKICEGGERISHLSDEVFSSFYKTKWIHCPHRIKTSMLIIQECSKKPLSIKASGITEINWNLFTKIMNSAYTYFNVLYAMDSTN
ncbi:odorant receptor Or2-like [Cimex lectularius]|uniref:Odorant receptor n=1 Tax=Cimex lectularius TaxID=79782 RepID=A0A8I6RQA6_CIMLE|nr:odorant receptor Or2-like [Cimex lectularius]